MLHAVRRLIKLISFWIRQASLNFFHKTKQNDYRMPFSLANASVKGNLELPLLKGRRSFDVETTSNLEVYIFRGW